MATKTSVGIKFKTKSAKPRATSHEEKLTGPEPEWTGDEVGEEYNVKLRKTMFYCNAHYTLKDLKPSVLRYVDSLGCFDKPMMRDLGAAYDAKTKLTITTSAAICYAAGLGASITDAHRDVVVNDFTTIINDYRNDKPKDTVEKTTVEVYKPTIQDRLTEKLREYIGDIEGVYDEVIMGGDPAPGVYDYCKVNNVPQVQANKIATHFQKYVAELTEAQTGKDAQLKEGYSHYKSKDFKRHLAFLNKVIEECDSYYKIKQTTRKARVPKAPSKEKLVGKMKFLVEDKLLKIASVSPASIVGAEELWVYNTRTRKLGRYVADEYAKTLSVKGTTIIGFDESKSVTKTLRKPDSQIKEFMKAGKVQTRKFMDTVKTTETRLNGRINSDTLLLKVL